MGQQVGNWSICHALWAKRKPIVQPILYPTHIFFIPSQSTFPFLKYGYQKFDLENPRSRSWVRSKFKVTTWVQHPTDSHPFMSIHPLICIIELFKYLTFKIQGQSHSWRSHNRYNILSIYIPFIPCWWAIPERQLFKKLTLKIQGQGHGWGQSSKSQCESNIPATHIPFIPCQSGILLLSYDFIKIWPWKSKVKVMGEVTV